MRDPEHPDRGFFLAVALCLAVGVSALGLAIVVAITAPAHPSYGVQRALGRAEGGGVLAGPIFILLALGALASRWWHGPQAPGRHTRDPGDDGLDLHARPFLAQDDGEAPGSGAGTPN